MGRRNEEHVFLFWSVYTQSVLSMSRCPMYVWNIIDHSTKRVLCQVVAPQSLQAARFHHNKSTSKQDVEYEFFTCFGNGTVSLLEKKQPSKQGDPWSWSEAAAHVETSQRHQKSLRFTKGAIFDGCRVVFKVPGPQKALPFLDSSRLNLGRIKSQAVWILGL